MKSLKKKYYALMALVIVAYAGLCYYFEVGRVSEIIGTVLALIAGVAFFLEYKNNERLNEGRFMMDLNNQFISNEHLTRVEHKLEVYNFELKEAQKKNPNVDPFTVPLQLELEVHDEERQHLINYLVHLEGIATLINTGVLTPESITNLFAFRYFVAVNNPIVQQKELIPYREYYKGCFAVYSEWERVLRERGITPPLAEYALNDI